MKRLLAIALAALALTACAPEQGTIEKKDYDASYFYWAAGTTTCSGGTNGQPRTCTTTPGHMQYVPENYGLYIVNGDKKGWVTVSEKTYEKASVGDYYDHGEVSEQ